VLFDLDGTLADTAPDLSGALNRLLAEHGKPLLDIETLRPTVSLGGGAMVRFAFDITDKDPAFAELLARFLDYYGERVAEETALFPGMAALLDTLETRGYRWGIVTNKMDRLTRPLLAELGLDARAACVVSGDTVAHRKPHPAPMLHACGLAGCEPANVVYVGDARRDVEAGKNAGMATLIADFGYLDDNDAPESWGADAIVGHPTQILDWIERESGR